MNRRDILKMVAATPMIAGGVKAAADYTPQDRLNAAINELKAAADAAHPGLIQDWTVKINPENYGCPLLVAAFTA